MSAYRHIMAKVGGVLALAAIFALSTVTPAEALFKLRLDDSSTGAVDVNVTDQGAGDLNPLVGAITASGAFGNFVVNVTTGVSKPIFTNPPHMDLNSINVNVTGGAGTLEILLTDTDWIAGPNPNKASLTFGGTLSGSAGSNVQARGYADDGNGEFVLSQLIGTVGPFGLGAFSGEAGGSFLASGSYSLTQRITLAYTGPVTFSGDFELIPEPTTLALFGLGLLGLGAGTRRRLQKKAAK